METESKHQNDPRPVDKMITDPELRKIARERKLRLDIVEKDYALGWILIGIYNSSLSNSLLFKGGTALSKIYFPFNWRISEDLDFTLSENSIMEDMPDKLSDELPRIVEDLSDGLVLDFKEEPYINPGFSRVRVQFNGPISKNTVKIEFTKENFIGDFELVTVSQTYDYPEYNALSYTLENIFSEKLRSLIERTKIRDYYDSWRLLEVTAIDLENAKSLFYRKCKAREIVFNNVQQFFPENLVETLEPYLYTLTRLTAEPLPPLRDLIQELKTSLEIMFQ